MTPSDALLTLGVELAGVTVFTLLAGAGDEVGSAVVLFMVGLWLIFLVSDSKVIAGISSAITNVAQQGQS